MIKFVRSAGRKKHENTIFITHRDDRPTIRWRCLLSEDVLLFLYRYSVVTFLKAEHGSGTSECC
jgi:hypothetical protein